jgi:hypothetical protein
LSTNSHFFGLDLLTDEERELYEKVKPYFVGRGKPTLKILAARLLRDPHDGSFSDRTVLRYIEALNDYKFADQNNRRDYMISSVNSFSIHNQSAKESARYAMAHAAAQIVPIIRQQMVPVIAQTAQVVSQTLPRIPDILPPLGQSLMLMRERLPYFHQTLPLIAHSVAQIPDVLPQIQVALADLHRSLPQTLSLLANANLNLGQN